MMIGNTDNELIKASIEYSDGDLLRHMQDMYKNTISWYYSIDSNNIASMYLWNLFEMPHYEQKILKNEISVLILIGCIKKFELTAEWNTQVPEEDLDELLEGLPSDAVVIIHLAIPENDYF
jgi:hypothetical protein